MISIALSTATVVGGINWIKDGSLDDEKHTNLQSILILPEETVSDKSSRVHQQPQALQAPPLSKHSNVEILKI